MKRLIEALTAIIPFLAPYPLWAKAVVMVWVVVSAILLLILLFARPPQHKKDHDDKIEVSGDNNIVIGDNKGVIEITYDKIYLDKDNKELDEFKEVRVLEDRIIDAEKGYIKFKIAKGYLNTKFDIPTTLKYKSGRYEPVTLTFKNHLTKGPGIIISSPEHEKNISVFLNEYINVGNALKIYTKDFIFNLYYNESKAFLYAESGEVSNVYNSDSTSSEPSQMPIKNIVFTGYFNEDGKNITAGTPPELGVLIKYFQTYKSSN